MMSDSSRYWHFEYERCHLWTLQARAPYIIIWNHEYPDNGYIGAITNIVCVPQNVCIATVFSVSSQHKCEQYWNNQLDKPYEAGRGFTVVTTRYRGFADYAVRDLTLKSVSSQKHSALVMNKTVTWEHMYYNYTWLSLALPHFYLPQPADGHLCVKQFQYTGWPDHGVPLQPSSLVKFIQITRKEFESTGAPIVIHCRLGRGVWVGSSDGD